MSTTETRAKTEITVSVAQLSQDIKDITVPQGSTLKDVLTELGYSDDALKEVLSDVLVDGEDANLDSKLNENSFVAISPKVEGGLH